MSENPAKPSLFGFGKPTNPTGSSTNLFGAPKTAGSLFGASATTNSTPSGADEKPKPTSGIFGSTTGALFGGKGDKAPSTSTPSSGSNLFGKSSGGSSLFGQGEKKKEDENQNPSEATKTQATPTGGLLGMKSSGGSLFGQNTSTFTTSTGEASKKPEENAKSGDAKPTSSLFNNPSLSKPSSNTPFGFGISNKPTE